MSVHVAGPHNFTGHVGQTWFKGLGLECRDRECIQCHGLVTQ